MENNFEMIQELLRTKAEYQARLNLMFRLFRLSIK